MQSLEHAFGHDPDEVARARAKVHCWLRGHRRRDDAVLAVSELVTNVIRHTRSGCGAVRLDVTDDDAVIRVRDDGTGTPRQQDPFTSGDGGRGLYIVAEVTDDWGCRALPAGGKEIWVRLVALPLADLD